MIVHASWTRPGGPGLADQGWGRMVHCEHLGVKIPEQALWAKNRPRSCAWSRAADSTAGLPHAGPS